MISLRNAAKELSVPYSNVYRWAKQQGFDTSHGLNDKEFQALKRSLAPETAQTAEIVYLEPSFKLNLPALKPIENTIVPIITDEQVEAVRAYVDGYAEMVKAEISQARRELEATRKRADEMELEAHRLGLLREQQEAELRKLRIEALKATESLGKSTSKVQGEA